MGDKEMTTAKVSIDDLLAENELVLTIGGKDYTVRDIALDSFLKIMKTVDDEKVNPELILDQLALFFAVERKELKGIGIKAAGLALIEINNWMTEAQRDLSVPEDVEFGGKVDAENP
jgi:hypothetical protein